MALLTEEELQARRDRNQKAREELIETKEKTERTVAESAQEFEIAQLDAEYERIQAAKKQAEELSARATATPTTLAPEQVPHGPASSLAPDGAPAPTGLPVHTVPEQDGPVLPDPVKSDDSADDSDSDDTESGTDDSDSDTDDTSDSAATTPNPAFGTGGGLSNFTTPALPEGN